MKFWLLLIQFLLIYFYNTALTIAAANGNSEAIKVLVERDDVNVNYISIFNWKIDTILKYHFLIQFLYYYYYLRNFIN